MLPKIPKIVQNGPIGSKIVQIGEKCSKILSKSARFQKFTTYTEIYDKLKELNYHRHNILFKIVFHKDKYMT